MLRSKDIVNKNNKEPLLFQIIDWSNNDIDLKNDDEEESDDESNNKYKKKKRLALRGYGVTNKGHSISIHIFNFRHYFYVKIPQNWTESTFRSFKNACIDKIPEYLQDGLYEFKMVYRKDFYGFTNNKSFKFAYLSFKNQRCYYGFKRLFTESSEKKIYIGKLKQYFDFSKKLYETKVPPLLRFFHNNDLSPSSWMKIEEEKYILNVPKQTRAQIDISVDAKHIEHIDLKQTPQIIVASFDIECTSCDGAFPKFTRPDDPIIQIGTSAYMYGDDNCALKYICTLKKSNPVEGMIVESYDNERDLLIGWAKFIEKLDPDIMTGYNIWGFDWEYIYERAKMQNCVSSMFKHLNRIKNMNEIKQDITIQEISSSALGQNILKYIQIEGIVQIDLLKVVQRDHKLDSYKLDNVSKVFMGQQKVDLSPAQLFENYREGSPEKIREIAVYCIKDCVLVNELINKLQVITNNMGMSNVCIVPLSFLFTRGQGIKIFSLVVKFCNDEKFIIKDLNDDDIDKNSYEGAIVFVPKPGIYFEPVVVMDYNSLYPSSMIAENISHDSMVGYKEYGLKEKKNRNDTDEYELVKDTVKHEYENIEGYHYIDIEYDIFQGIDDDKKKIGYKVCKFAEPDNGDKSLLPRILRKLLKARKDTRKVMKYKTITTKSGESYEGLYEEKDNGIVEINNLELGVKKYKKDDIETIVITNNDFQIGVLDGLQLAYKVTCNSLYGQVGASTSPICFKELAACTTATGRKMVIVARDLTLEKFEGSKLTYGDSVASYTPIYVKYKNKLDICTIEELGKKYGNNIWLRCIEEGKETKEYCELDNIETWTENRWTKLFRIIRHNLSNQKKMIRILTHTGMVDVTDDHSLLKIDGNEISPKDITIGTELMHKKIDFKLMDENITIDEARIYGFFFGDGSCGSYNCKSGNQNSWALNNSNLDIINKYVKLCEKVYNNFNWKYYETLESSGVYKLTFTSNKYGDKKKFINEYRKNTYYENCKIIPDFILNSNEKIRKSFWEGLYDADGDKDKNGYTRIDQKNQISAANICLLAQSIGYKTSINIRKDKPNIYRITCTKGYQRKNPNKVKKIVSISNYNDYVYDLTTENHHFAAGIGNLIVHNTDSVFINFSDTIRLRNPGQELTEKDLLKQSIVLGEEAAEHINTYMKAPQNIEYEKTFWPFCIFSKKRYFGNKYEFDLDKYKQTSMGIVLKRRDNAPIVKTIYGGVIDIILNKRNVDESKAYFKKAIENLLEGKIDISQLVVSKTVRTDYSNPTLIAHKVLADRMGDRDPGNKPQSNDRIPYCYIEHENLKCKVCDIKVNPDTCKCVDCMNIYCYTHLGNHRSICIKICRFCRKTNDDLVNDYQEEHNKNASEEMKKKITLDRCNTCFGNYCKPCFVKHNIRKDKYKVLHNDKCKKPLSNKLLQGDLIEHPLYITEKKLKINYNYYLTNQIEKPVFQIFDLVMKNPKTIIEDVVRKQKNKKNGNASIKLWFKAMNNNTNLTGQKEKSEFETVVDYNQFDEDENMLEGFEEEDDKNPDSIIYD